MHPVLYCYITGILEVFMLNSHLVCSLLGDSLSILSAHHYLQDCYYLCHEEIDNLHDRYLQGNHVRQFR